MRTYRELFRAPEYLPLFVTSTFQVAATTVTGLALATLVYADTGSPFLAAFAMFGPSLAQVAGAVVLLSAADRLPARPAIAGLAVLFGLGAAVVAVPGLPVAAAIAIVVCLGPFASLAAGVRNGLLNQILPRAGFLLGRSVLNIATGVMQIGGFAIGGVLLTVVSPAGLLVCAAVLHLAGAVAAVVGLADHPPRATGRPSVAATWRANGELLASVPRRYTLIAMCVPNGLIVGCESLFVSYAPAHAGLLFACASSGMLAGDVLVGRFVPHRLHRKLGTPLRFLLAVPFLVFPLTPPLAVAMPVIGVAAVGFAATLLLQQRLLVLTPDELSGHALGLHASTLLTMQGVGATIAGAVAEITSPATAMGVMAAASVAVTLALQPGLREDHPATTEGDHARSQP